MKTLKITLSLIAIAMLTVSSVQTNDVVADNEPTFKEYTPGDQLAVDKRRLKLKTRA
jgi:hypothetical protein